jgi:hypothetical protein
MEQLQHEEMQGNVAAEKAHQEVQETQEHLGDTSQQNQLTAGPAEAPGPI